MSDGIGDSLGYVNLRGSLSDRRFAAGVEAAVGQAPPDRPNTVSLGTHRVYWLGPDEWLIVTAIGDVAEVVRKLHAALDGQNVAINDLSGGQVAFRLSGHDVPERLARGCTLDLHPEKFGLGACAQTGLAKANVLLGHVAAGPTYELVVRRSFSDYLRRWLHHVGLISDSLEERE